MTWLASAALARLLPGWPGLDLAFPRVGFRFVAGRGALPHFSLADRLLRLTEASKWAFALRFRLEFAGAAAALRGRYLSRNCLLLLEQLYHARAWGMQGVMPYLHNYFTR